MFAKFYINKEAKKLTISSKFKKRKKKKVGANQIDRTGVAAAGSAAPSAAQARRAATRMAAAD